MLMRVIINYIHATQAISYPICYLQTCYSTTISSLSRFLPLSFFSLIAGGGIVSGTGIGARSTVEARKVGMALMGNFVLQHQHRYGRGLEDLD